MNAVWHTSMEVCVRVEAENPRTGEVRHTSTAYLTMVALDDAGAPDRRAAAAHRLTRRGAPISGRRSCAARNRLAEREQIRAGRAGWP